MKKKLATILFVLFQNTNKKSAKTSKKKKKGWLVLLPRLNLYTNTYWMTVLGKKLNTILLMHEIITI